MKKSCIFLLGILFSLGLCHSVFAGCAYYDMYNEHDYFQVNTVYPTCDEDGYYELYCRSCGITVYETVPAYGHDWNWIVIYDATCTEEGLGAAECSTCLRRDYEPIQPYGHNWIDIGVIRQATCTQEGLSRMQCNRCWTTTDSSTGRASHTYGSWTVTQQATDHSQGTRSRSCTQCGTSYSENFYPEGTVYRGGGNDASVVRALQQGLLDLHILNDVVDGIFGRNTEAAVREFQSRYHLTADGIGWPQTQDMVRRAVRGEFDPTPTPIPTPTATPIPTPTQTPIPTPTATPSPAPTATPTPAPTAAPTPEPTPTPEESFPYCRQIRNDEGEKVTEVCAHHTELNAKLEELLAKASDTETRISLLEEAVQSWDKELNGLYDRWQNLNDEPSQMMIRVSRKSFESSILKQREEMEAEGAAEEEILQENLLLYMKQTAKICEKSNWYLSGVWKVTAARTSLDGENIEVPEITRTFTLNEDGTASMETPDAVIPARWQITESGVLVETEDEARHELELEENRLLSIGEDMILVLER